MSDLLVSIIDSTQERQPELIFDHVMSNVVVNIISIDSFDGAELTLNALNNAICNLSTQSYISKGSTTTINAATVDGLGLKAIVAPQSIAANTVFATLTVGERVYNWTLLDTLTFESGRQYSFNWDLAINEVVPIGIINGWGDSANDVGTDIAYTRLSDYSATSYPETAETWVIYDVYANTDNFEGLQAALNAISGSILDTREISIEFPNLINVPSSALYSDNSSSSSITRSTCLKRISLPSATIISSSAFYNCTTLESISSPELISIKDNAFYGCSSLSSIDLPKVIYIGTSAFYGCTSILTLMAESIVHVGDEAFKGMHNLVSIYLPNAQTLGSGSSLGVGSFNSCYNLIDIYIPKVTTITGPTFASCSSLTSISIPNLTTASSSTNAGYGTFSYCTNIRYMTIATESILESLIYFFYNVSTQYITLTIGKEHADYVNGNILTTYTASGSTTDYTFYEIIIAD